MAQTNSPLRRPLDTQRNLGGDMSMMFFVRPKLPRKFSSPDQQLVKGLNVETIAFVDIQPPPWLEDFHYRALIETSDREPSKGVFFSLNVSVYNRPLVTSDWEDLLFFFNGRVHPYALTWEVTLVNDTDTSDDTQNYTIPALIVRDNGYYPIAGRMFDNLDELPLPSPIVTFTGPIVGPGSQLLLDDESISGITDIQRKCCGFVQLSTFITPGNPTKSPFRGFHPFQVFVIFPLDVNPWTFLCKKMAERQDSHFQPNTLFSCTGKVVGLLNHRLMSTPPPSTQDHIFIVVPDTWSFPERSNHSLLPFSTSATPVKQSSTESLGRSQFMTPSKPISTHLTTPPSTPSQKRKHITITPESCTSDKEDDHITITTSKSTSNPSTRASKRARVETSPDTSSTIHKPLSINKHTTSEPSETSQSNNTRRLRNQ